MPKVKWRSKVVICRIVGSGGLEVPIGDAVEVGDCGITMCWLTEGRSCRSGSVTSPQA